MGQRKVVVALAATACAAVWGPYPSAGATGAEIRTVRVALFPENAAVAVDGHPRQHSNGTLELRGPLGSVFTIEAVANGVTIVQRVAITEIGALPSRLAVAPHPQGLPLVLPTPLEADLDDTAPSS